MCLGWLFEAISGKLHVTTSGGSTWHNGLDPRHLRTRSERIGKSCAAKVCGLFKSGYRTCAHRNLQPKRTGSRSLSPTVLTPKKIKISSMLYPNGATSEA